MADRIAVVRLGAMGDVIHALPAVASLKHVTWIIEPRWAPLLAGNAGVDEVILLDRRRWSSVRDVWNKLRGSSFRIALDLQGLIKSALVVAATGAPRRVGYDTSQLRERAAAWFYNEQHRATGVHIVDRHCELAAACGATGKARRFPLPQGKAEGHLPDEYVLACPFAGWASKEWPLGRYGDLAKLLPIPLVLNGHAAVEAQLRAVPGVVPHISSIDGLIHATRKARAIVGVDSGPLHLAAALGKCGVAIFGPTDPQRNGPYGNTIRVLRTTGALTSYKRRAEADPSMLAISPEMVATALQECF
jgi:heptosyltransferase-1